MTEHVPIAPDVPNRRALILPGGGMRVAYQAGILKALHDAGLRFSIADGASGGTMNLAALLGGATPDALCARWRTLPVSHFVSLRSVTTYLKLTRSGALGDFDGIEGVIFPHLGIDAVSVRASTGVQASFNVCDFDDKVVVPVPHREIAHELLLAGISLPLMTPPVRWRGRTWTDAVWISDSNLLAAVAAGAQELWVAWCIGNTGRFEDGLLEQYVHMIEMAAIGHFNAELAAVAALNRSRAAAGDPPIVVHVIRPERPLPLDPAFLSGRIDAATLIARGYRDASRYLSGPRAGSPLGPAATKMSESGEGVTFRERMRGRITFGETDPDRGYASDAAIPIALHAAIEIDDVAGFVRDPDHRGGLVGHLELHRAGGWLPATDGVFALFAPTSDPRLTHMIYRMSVLVDGRPMFFNGRKHVGIAGPWRLWRATTTLYVTVHEGTDPSGPIVAAGRLSLGMLDLWALLGTLHATGCRSRRSRWRTTTAFVRFFTGELWRTYVTRRHA